MVFFKSILSKIFLKLSLAVKSCFLKSNFRGRIYWVKSALYRYIQDRSQKPEAGGKLIYFSEL